MGAKTEIAWTDATWTPLRARVREDAADTARAKGYTSLVQIAAKMAGHVGPHCEHASPGCLNCYSETNNSRCLPNNGTGLPFDRRSRDLVETFLDDKIMYEPFHWRKPRKIFVCSQTDLLGEWVPDALIFEVLDTIAGGKQHQFQILTKRASRLPEVMERYYAKLRKETQRFEDIADMRGFSVGWEPSAPLENLWLGVSIEDRAHKDRIDLLRKTPATVRFLSLEPLLEDLGELDLAGIQLVIVGGESGPGARPCDVAWIRSIVQQCKAAGVACFVKQLGASPIETDECDECDGYAENRNGNPCVRCDATGEFVSEWHFKDRKGGDMDEWPHELRVREMPEVSR